MRKLIWSVLLILLTPLAFFGCSSDDGDGSGGGSNDFVGQWHVSGSQGNYYVTFTDDGSIIMADSPGGAAHLTGSYTVSGDTASGPLSNPGVGTAEFNATLTGKDTMDFEFIEHWGPGKHIPLTGTRM